MRILAAVKLLKKFRTDAGSLPVRLKYDALEKSARTGLFSGSEILRRLFLLKRENGGVVDSHPRISTTLLPNGTQGDAYSETIAVTGGDAPLTFSVFSGDLPSGLTLDADTGEISGTPDTAEAQDFVIRVTDADGDTDDQSLSITIDASVALTNFALAANGSTISSNVAAIATTNLDAVINGNRRCPNWGGGSGTVTGNGYHSAQAHTVVDPIYFDVDFGQSRTISEIDIFFVPSPENTATDPTLSDTGHFAGTKFDVQYWNGAAWVTIESTETNDHIWFQSTFSPVTTTKIRINTRSGTVGFYDYTLLAEIEAWG